MSFSSVFSATKMLEASQMGKRLMLYYAEMASSVGPFSTVSYCTLSTRCRCSESRVSLLPVIYSFASVFESFRLNI